MCPSLIGLPADSQQRLVNRQWPWFSAERLPTGRKWPEPCRPSDAGMPSIGRDDVVF